MFLEKNRDRIEKDFEDFSRELPGKAEEIEKRMETLNADIVIGMKYLYSNMPYSDVGNYTFDTYLDYVQQGIWLWENSPYVKKYPELYFLIRWRFFPWMYTASVPNAHAQSLWGLQFWILSDL